MGTAIATRLAAVVLVLAVAGATFLLISGRSEVPAAPVAVPVGASSLEGTSAAQTDASTESASASAVVVVHVAGAVVHPGVVELSPGTRVDEAISAAGGATEAADLDALNLAAPVVDGQQVYVPREGEAAPPAAVGSDPSVAGPGSLVDINSADVTALDTLPGIGPALAQRIVDWRTEHGPFASVEALTDVSGIGPATMERLRTMVTV